MISTDEAISLIDKNTLRLGLVSSSLHESLGRVLAVSPSAEIDLPPFDQSAMDGYALKLGTGDTFTVIGEIKAGDDPSAIVLEENEAIKIFTGAVCPKSADIVCRIEDIKENGKTISILKMPKRGANIRLRGEQIASGDKSLPEGLIINPAAIGFLANLGIDRVEIHQPPKINIISTGNELIVPGSKQQLSPGEIFESNGIMLKAALEDQGYPPVELLHLKDSYDTVFKGISNALEQSDVLILSGGISMGDYDFVEQALLENGVKQIFYKINQKPGKPLFFGTKGDKLIFALPGNPAAALTCFYIYVLPALNKLAGKGFVQLDRKKAISKDNLIKENAREQFLKASYKNNEVSILEGQSSAMLMTFSTANALLYVPTNTSIHRGDEVEVITIL